MTAFAAHEDWTGVVEQVVITVGAVLITLVPVLVSLHRKADKNYRMLNNVYDEEQVPDGNEDTTLGSLLREVQKDVRTGFKRNDEVHGFLGQMVEMQGQMIVDHTQRIEANHQELNRIWSELRHIRQRPPAA